VVRDDQPEAREGQAGRPGVAERSVVPLKPVNAGRGKGPQFKTDARRGEGPGDWATYQLRRVFRNCRRRCTRKRRQKPATASTPCTTRSAGKTSWPMPKLNAAPTWAHRAWTVRTLRTSRRTECSGGLANWRLRSGRRRIDRTLSEECTYRRPMANSDVPPTNSPLARFRGDVRTVMTALGLSYARGTGSILDRRAI
jgi:hypothetical protein